jgi:hypothetical protein
MSLKYLETGSEMCPTEFIKMAPLLELRWNEQRRLFEAQKNLRIAVCMATMIH